MHAPRKITHHAKTQNLLPRMSLNLESVQYFFHCAIGVMSPNLIPILILSLNSKQPRIPAAQIDFAAAHGHTESSQIPKRFG